MRGVPTLTLPPDINPDREASERSFDFPKLPRLKEVNFSHPVHRIGGASRPWIPMALSTLCPTTSPHLSFLQVAFPGSPSNLPESSIENLRNDLQRVRHQITRIKREFEGAVNFTVILDPKFEAVSNIQYLV